MAVFFALMVWVFPSAAWGAEVINNFDVTASQTQGRGLIFEEKIKYDFGDAQKHGIYRYIPETYERNGYTYNYRLQVLGVARDGAEEPFSVSHGNGNVIIKIGDESSMLTGQHDYTIRYATDRALNFFSDHDELYWNIAGSSWQVPMEQSSFTFMLPGNLDPKSVTSTCFSGQAGSKQNDCAVSSAEHAITYRSTRVLEPGEGMTVVYGFPVGTFPRPTLWEKFLMLLWDNLALFIPVIVFAIMFWRWYTKGRDPKLGTVIPEYEAPQKFSPAMIGAAMSNGMIPNRTVTATIIDLARRGYLKIRFGEQKELFGKAQTFTFVKQKGADDNLEDYEKTIQQGLFKGGDERTVQDLSDGKFYTAVTAFNSQVGKKINDLKLFDANPVMVRVIYMVIGFGMGWMLLLAFSGSALGSACAVVSGAIVAIFGWFMPRRTSAGIRLLADIKGFKLFLSVTEKDRLDFHNAPERTPEQFQVLLPYAIVFGVENKWAAQFATLSIPPPNWAEGNLNGFNAVMLASSLNSLHAAASSSAFSPPSSAGAGGSGFSGGGVGGGGGGGGGGSW